MNVLRDIRDAILDLFDPGIPGMSSLGEDRRGGSRRFRGRVCVRVGDHITVEGAMTLQSQVARWDELTAAERDALVAVHVMGWHLYYRYWWTEGEGSPPQGHCTGKNEYGWNPTTDRNDCAEAVRALRLSGKQEKSLNMKISRLIGYADGPLFYYLVDPKDVCRAMLEALAEREE